MPPSIFNQDTIEYLRNVLLKRSESVAVAESVTSGLLQFALSQAKDASCFFQGGITAYNLGQKTRHLDIDPIYAAECDCVSDALAASMARVVADRFSSKWGLAITGYAALASEAGVSELFAWYSISYKGQTLLTEKLHSEEEEGWPSQFFYVEQMLGKWKELLSAV